MQIAIATLIKACLTGYSLPGVTIFIAALVVPLALIYAATKFNKSRWFVWASFLALATFVLFFSAWLFNGVLPRVT